MKALLILFFAFFSATLSIAQGNYSFTAKKMHVGRCGSIFSGQSREMPVNVNVSEFDNRIVIHFQDGTLAYDLPVHSVRPADSEYGVTYYRLEQNNYGIQTVILDLVPDRMMISLMRSDQRCTTFWPLEVN
jgi:hypothetical protein